MIRYMYIAKDHKETMEQIGIYDCYDNPKLYKRLYDSMTEDIKADIKEPKNAVCGVMDVLTSAENGQFATPYDAAMCMFAALTGHDFNKLALSALKDYFGI